MEFFDGNAVFALLLMRRIRRLRRQRSMWVHPLTNARLYHGQYYTIMTELRNDNEKFFNYFRMSQNTFNELLSVIKKLHSETRHEYEGQYSTRAKTGNYSQVNDCLLQHLFMIQIPK